MSKWAVLLLLMLIPSVVFAQHQRVTRESQHPLRHKAKRIRMTTDSFDNILDSSDTNLQTPIDSIDDLISNTAPSSPTSTCSPRQLAVADTYLYACVSTDTWVRTTMATWTVSADYLLLESGDVILLEAGDNIIIE